MFALPHDPETEFLESLYGTLMIYPWQTGHNSTRLLRNELLGLYLGLQRFPDMLVLHP
jgi:hypothetical protein